MSLAPVVADMNHANPVGSAAGGEPAGFAALKAAGLIGIIHKARQGIGFGDPAFARRRDRARAAGLMFGAYDFATHDVVADNVADFLSFSNARADPALALWLDFEDNRASQMTAAQAKEFLDRVDQATGRACGIYGGSRIVEQISANKALAGDPFWTRHPLWLCQYKTGAALRNADLPALKPHIAVPAPWRSWFLLQYTGDGVGPLPHSVRGLENGADLNVFDGAAGDLARLWAGPAPPALS
jgi:lysozyme